MKKRRYTIVAVVGAWLACAAVSAQTVYRCGNAYSHQPCADGRPVDVADQVTAERHAQAREAAWREARLGDALARERRAEAAAHRPALAGSLGPVAQATARSLPVKKKVKAKRKPAAVQEAVDGDFVARVPKARAAAS